MLKNVGISIKNSVTIDERLQKVTSKVTRKRLQWLDKNVAKSTQKVATLHT